MANPFNIHTNDNVTYPYTLGKCWTLLSADCGPHPSYAGKSLIIFKICTKRPKYVFFLNKNIPSGNSETKKFLEKLDFSVTVFNNFDQCNWVFLAFFDNF